MADDVEKTMRAVMKYVYFELKKRNIPVTEFLMQKIIFKLKMELGKEHELYERLPFYWYLKGPYSEVATEIYETQIPLWKETKLGTIEYPEIEPLLYELMKNQNYLLNEIDKDIYKKYAPYRFMYDYKYKIYEHAENKNEVDFDIEKYIDIFTSCCGNLPINKYFNDFNTEFTRLLTYLDLIFIAGNFEKYWEFLQKSIMKIWETFVKGVRIYFKDTYYNDREKIWDKEFKNDLKELTLLIKKTKKYINYDDYPKNNYTPEQIKILNTTIGSYLEGEYEK